MPNPISGFSKKNKAEKIAWLASQYLEQDPDAIEVLKNYWHQDEILQQLHDDFIENTLTNYYLPRGIAPNCLINDKLYALPMVTEESSVVAAASNAAKFWLDRGGFKAEVISTVKNGQVHFNYFGNVMTISLMGSLLLLPLLIINWSVQISETILLTGFGITVLLMFLEHKRRVKLLKLPSYLTYTWVLYRVLILLTILILN